MNIKIEFVISANPELLAALQVFTGNKFSSIPVPELLNGNKEERKTRTKKTETPVVSMEKTADEIETKDAVQEVKTDLTQEMIIADAVPKSKAGHKDKIKAKVTELGYESITNLQPVHFDEFYAFLQTIPKPA